MLLVCHCDLWWCWRHHWETLVSGILLMGDANRVMKQRRFRRCIAVMVEEQRCAVCWNPCLEFELAAMSCYETMLARPAFFSRLFEHCLDSIASRARFKSIGYGHVFACEKNSKCACLVRILWLLLHPDAVHLVSGLTMAIGCLCY